MFKDIKSQSLAIIILVLSLVLAVYLLGYPAAKNVSRNNIQLKNLKDEQQNLKKAQQELAAFLSKYEKVSDKAVVAGAALPDQPELPTLLATIDDMAKVAGIALGSISFNENADPTSLTDPYAVRSADIDLTGSGSYPSFKDFLLRLESNLRLVDIQKTNFQVDTANFIRFGMSIKVYYQR